MFIIAIMVISIGLTGLLPIVYADSFADRTVIVTGTDLTGDHTFGEHII